METCPRCGYTDPVAIPPEPPIGTWVKDKRGSVSKRHLNGGWAPPGFYPMAQWEAMWQAHGPLIVCGPWGEDIE